MRVIGILCVAAGAFLSGEPVVTADARDEVAELPAAVRAAVAVLAGSNAIEEVEQSTTNGMVIHEVAWQDNGHEQEAELTEAGDLVELEEGLPAADVPAAVRAAAAQVLGAEPTSYTRRFIVVYEVSATVAGKEREALVLPTGSMLDDDDAFEGRSLSRDDGDDDDSASPDDDDDDDQGGDGDDDDDGGGDDDDDDDGPDDD